MKLTRALGAGLGVLAGLFLVPAQAADASLSVNVAPRWEVSTPGSWTPYQVTIKNDGGGAFEGDVFLVPEEVPYAPARGTYGAQWPSYQSHLSLGRGQAEKSVTIYVLQSPFGYRAEVRSQGGQVMASNRATGGVRSGYAVGILSDAHGGDAVIGSLSPLNTAIAASHFTSARDFPSSAVHLNGLQVVVVDDFDTATLSQAQVQALRDFVGFGGTLVLGGGASWRRTLLPLPSELAPLRPNATVSASLAPLAALAGKTTEMMVPVVAGDVRDGRAVLGAPGGLPLVVEGGYGGGRIVQLTYDPLADPLAANGTLSSLAWAQALVRALPMTNSYQKGGPVPGFGGTGVPPGAAGGPPLIATPDGSDQAVRNLLEQSPAAAAPPLGLLGLLLVAYVLIAGPFNYLLLKRMGRRELMWATVPMVAVVFSGATYAVGFGTRGSDFVDNVVQMQRMAPDGSVQTASYHGVFSPTRGDHRVSLPANTLATTALGAAGSSFTSEPSRDVVLTGARTEVMLRGVAVWEMRTVQTISVARQPVLLEGHLAYAQGLLQGRLVNRGNRPLRRLTLYGSGLKANLAAALAPGAGVDVSTGLDTGPANRGGGPGVQAGEETVLAIAAGQLLARPGQLALVALVDVQPDLLVDGARPHYGGLAAVAQSIKLESSDSLVGGVASARLVSTFRAAPNWVDVYDLDLPAGVRGGLALRYMTPPVARGSQGTVAEVYDWQSGSWRRLPTTGVGAQGQRNLDPSEYEGGSVRVRVQELNPFNSANLQLVAAGPAS